MERRGLRGRDRAGVSDPLPVGTNLERFAEYAAPVALMVALLAQPRLRPVRRALLVAALVFSSGWTVKKTVDDLKVSTDVPAWAAQTDGVVRALESLGADRTRVEAVPARNHREAVALAPHVHLARGWNRQLDMERARLFYDGSFSAAAYRAWLDRWAVGFVVLHDGRPDGYAEEEARLVRSGGPTGWCRSGATRTGRCSGSRVRCRWCPRRGRWCGPPARNWCCGWRGRAR